MQLEDLQAQLHKREEELQRALNRFDTELKSICRFISPVVVYS